MILLSIKATVFKLLKVLVLLILLRWHEANYVAVIDKALDSGHTLRQDSTEARWGECWFTWSGLQTRGWARWLRPASRPGLQLAALAAGSEAWASLRASLVCTPNKHNLRPGSELWNNLPVHFIAFSGD